MKRAIAIGNFDGFHLGHQQIVHVLKEISRKDNIPAAIITFSPNPKIYFKKEHNFISTDKQKRQMLESLGVEEIIFQNFEEISHYSGEKFIQHYLIDRLQMAHLIVGENFKFGKNRKTDLLSIHNMAHQFGFCLNSVKPVLLDGVRISSTLVREKLKKGSILEANRMLGKSYYIDGWVIEGEKIGREMGFPTINLRTANTILPEGVFETMTQVGAKQFKSITNIGYRPTFCGNDIKVETHILNFDKNIYGENVRVFFEDKIRNEIKFETREQLIFQISKDMESLFKIDIIQ